MHAPGCLLVSSTQDLLHGCFFLWKAYECLQYELCCWYLKSWFFTPVPFGDINDHAFSLGGGCWLHDGSTAFCTFGSSRPYFAFCIYSVPSPKWNAVVWISHVFLLVDSDILLSGCIAWHKCSLIYKLQLFFFFKALKSSPVLCITKCRIVSSCYSGSDITVVDIPATPFG